MPPPRPEQRHGVDRDNDVDRVVVARGEDEERLHRAQQYAEASQSVGGASRSAPDGLTVPFKASKKTKLA